MLRKICGVTRRDRRWNLDILKELDIHKDIVQVLQTRRLTMWPAWEATAIHICFCMDILTIIVQKEDRGRNGWTTSVMIVRSWVLQSMRLHNSLPTGQDGGTLFIVWAASAHWHRHCRHGNKSSKSNILAPSGEYCWTIRYHHCSNLLILLSRTRFIPLCPYLNTEGLLDRERDFPKEIDRAAIRNNICSNMQREFFSLNFKQLLPSAFGQNNRRRRRRQL